MAEPAAPARILVRATNWVGDAVMSLSALAALRARFPGAHIAVLARPWVADLYHSEPFADEIIPYRREDGWRAAAARVREGGFDCALLLQNAFEAAWIAQRAGVPRRIGYARDARGWLLTDAVAVPRAGEIPPHESFYYLELLRRAGWLETLPSQPEVRLRGVRREPANIIGVSPGAAYGNAKRWPPELFLQAAAELAGALGAEVHLHGSKDESALCADLARQLNARGVTSASFAGATSLAEFIRRAASCRLYLTNDSGAMHIASALGVPTVAVFGATNHVTTGPTGAHSLVIRQDVDCSPCLLRECPLDHRCMTAVTPERVAREALSHLRHHEGTD